MIDILRQSHDTSPDVTAKSPAVSTMVVDAMPSSSDRMSTLLSDSRTIAGIRTFASRSRDWVIGELIRFLVLFPETDDLTECLHELAGKQDEYHDFLLRSIVRTLGLTSPFTLEKRKSILRYWFERTNLDGYMFHSFNGSLESSIRTHGIHPDERAWDPQDLRKIQAIGKLRGFSLLLNGTEDIGKIYVGSYYDKIYGYARSSPEWFAQFVAEGRNGSGYDRTAYYRRDYARAKENILLLCEEIKRESLLYSRPPLSVEEECEILSFFEKYWSLLAWEDSEPKCALIRASELLPRDRTSLMDAEEARIEGYCDSIESMKHYIVLNMRGLGSDFSDCPIESAIPPERIERIVTLPSHTAVYGD